MSDSEIKSSEQSYLASLDGWRAIAIIGVIVYHGLTTVFYPNGIIPSYRALKLIQFGHRGVDLFFGLSGFLICTKLINEYKISNSISLKRFYIRRAYRILPAFWFYIIIIVLLSSIGLIKVDTQEILASLFFIRNYVGAESGHAWYTGHIWSLSVEEHFYILWPLVILLIGINRLFTLTFLLAILVPVRSIASYYINYQLVGRGNSTDARIDGLLWGCWVALIFTNPRLLQLLKRYLTSWVWLIALAASIAFIAFEIPWHANVLAFLIPWLIVATVMNPDWRISRFLETKMLKYIGRLSYSLYLWQQLWMFGRFSEIRPFELGILQELPLNIMLTFVCANISHYLIERPLIVVGHKRTSVSINNSI